MCLARQNGAKTHSATWGEGWRQDTLKGHAGLSFQASVWNFFCLFTSVLIYFNQQQTNWLLWMLAVWYNSSFAVVFFQRFHSEGGRRWEQQSQGVPWSQSPSAQRGFGSKGAVCGQLPFPLDCFGGGGGGGVQVFVSVSLSVLLWTQRSSLLSVAFPSRGLFWGVQVFVSISLTLSVCLLQCLSISVSAPVSVCVTSSKLYTGALLRNFFFREISHLRPCAS